MPNEDKTINKRLWIDHRLLKEIVAHTQKENTSVEEMEQKKEDLFFYFFRLERSILQMQREILEHERKTEEYRKELTEKEGCREKIYFALTQMVEKAEEQKKVLEILLETERLGDVSKIREEIEELEEGVLRMQRIVEEEEKENRKAEADISKLFSRLQ